MLGGISPPANDPVEVLVDPTSRFGPLHGLRIHVARWEDRDVRRIDTFPVTSPERTCWDLASWLDIVEAVALIDSLLSCGAVTIEQLRAYVTTREGKRGWKRLTQAVELVDAKSESPQESKLRVRLVRAGLPRPVAQYVITRAGHFIARVDLAWPEFKVAVEYDGLWHNDPAQFHRDRERLNRILGEEWIVLHVTAKRLRADFDGVVAEIRAALRIRRH